MAQKKVDANVLENLKFAFLDQADPNSLKLPISDVRGLIQYAFGMEASTFEEKVLQCLIDDDSTEFVKFDQV